MNSMKSVEELKMVPSYKNFEYQRGHGILMRGEAFIIVIQASITRFFYTSRADFDWARADMLLRGVPCRARDLETPCSVSALGGDFLFGEGTIRENLPVPVKGME